MSNQSRFQNSSTRGFFRYFRIYSAGWNDPPRDITGRSVKDIRFVESLLIASSSEPAAARDIFVITRELGITVSVQHVKPCTNRWLILCNDLVRNEEKTERYSISVSFDPICHAHTRSAIRVTSCCWPAPFFSACPKDGLVKSVKCPGSDNGSSVWLVHDSLAFRSLRYSRSPADARPKIFYYKLRNSVFIANDFNGKKCAYCPPPPPSHRTV